MTPGNERPTLPPGQRELMGPAPRFGLPRYLRARISLAEHPGLIIDGGVDDQRALSRADLEAVPQMTRSVDLHCVMTWSSIGVEWTGWSFDELWTQLLQPMSPPGITELVFSGLDGATASIALEDLLDSEVLLAHTRESMPLGRDHGAPYRLLAPRLYGYKNLKHVCRIELSEHHVRGPHEPWIMHRRGRVEHEERSGFGPRRLVRAVNRAFVRRALGSYGVEDPTFR